MEQQNAPVFLKSINELSSLGAAVQVFERRFQELQNHLDFIQTAIDIKLRHETSPSHQNADQLQRLTEKMPLQPQPQSLPPTETQTLTEMATKNVNLTQGSRPSELHYLCEMMCSRGLRKYLVTHLSDVETLRRDSASALKLAPKPAKLVLDCVGRFFLQGKKAYTKDSPMISSRQASVLVLEFFLRLITESGSHIEIDETLKQEAEKDSVAWRKRLLSEGGLSKACEVDARGLLLFVACFGIPKVFKSEDVRDLIRFSNITEISDLLKRSGVIFARVPDIIENMKKNGMHVEAVDIVYNFGIEDKFSPYTILTSLLRETREAWKRKRRDAPHPLKKATEKHLAALKSVVKCLEDRKIDPAKLLSGWQIKEKIVKLEKEIVDLNKLIMDDNKKPKRKAGQIQSSNNFNFQETKRSRFTTNGSTLVSSPHVIRLHEPMAANSYIDRKRSYNTLMPHLLTGGYSSYISNHLAAPAASHGYEAAPLPEALGSIGPSGGTVHAIGVEVGLSSGSSVLPSTAGPSGVHREESKDAVGQMMCGSVSSNYGWQSVGVAAYNDRVIGQPAAKGVDGLYEPPSYFPGPSINRCQ
ncbi:protein FRIGIDA-like isoform X2 [Mangifera indica]|uniref:protein FRIGIDA-like isoform X2 n=1 Tax=Mangifera indica TaxID=29780 RepID=UPI001CFA0DA4|nr:protein FRIGIDA-like isoform X2 [Mangifera indica]